MVPVSTPKPTVGWFFGGWGFQVLSASPACYRIHASIPAPLGSSHAVLCPHLLHLVGYLFPGFSFLYNHAILAVCPSLGPHSYSTHHHRFHGPVQFTGHVRCTTFSPCPELFQRPLSTLHSYNLKRKRPSLFSSTIHHGAAMPSLYTITMNPFVLTPARSPWERY